MNVQARYIPGSRRHRLDLALSQELRAGERVIWRAEQLGVLNPTHFAMYVFAVPWTAFSLLWTTLAASGVSSMQGIGGGAVLAWAFPMFGLPFIAVGIGMMAMPFRPWWERGKVLYAITDQRVLKLRLGRHLNVETCPKERVGAHDRTENNNGAGTLKLAVAIGRDSDGDRMTEHFVIGPVADIRGAQRTLNQLVDGQTADAPD